MIIDNIEPHSLDWNNVLSEKITGETGFTIVKTQIVGDIKIRLVEYSDNYKADHWCDKGHIVHILKGELIIEYKDDTVDIIQNGMTYIIGDNTKSHKANSKNGATVLIID